MTSDVGCKVFITEREFQLLDEMCTDILMGSAFHLTDRTQIKLIQKLRDRLKDRYNRVFINGETK